MAHSGKVLWGLRWFQLLFRDSPSLAPAPTTTSMGVGTSSSWMSSSARDLVSPMRCFKDTNKSLKCKWMRSFPPPLVRFPWEKFPFSDCCSFCQGPRVEQRCFQIPDYLKTRSRFTPADWHPSERINDCCSKPLSIGIQRPHMGRCLKAESPLQMLNMVPTDWPLLVKEEIFLS